MSATGLVLDAVLMLLLVAALAFGLRLERKLTALREGQAAFAGAVVELNQAAARAEAALGSLRAASQETDLLHDRIVKARALKGELEAVLARHGSVAPALAPVRAQDAQVQEATSGDEAIDGDAAARMAALRRRLETARGDARPVSAKPTPVTSLQKAIRALTEARSATHQTAQRPALRRPQDEDLFAA